MDWYGGVYFFSEIRTIIMLNWYSNRWFMDWSTCFYSFNLTYKQLNVEWIKKERCKFGWKKDLPTNHNKKVLLKHLSSPKMAYICYWKVFILKEFFLKDLIFTSQFGRFLRFNQCYLLNSWENWLVQIFYLNAVIVR